MTVQRAKTQEVRFAFCHLAEPYAFDETQQKKYSLNILIDKEDKVTLGAVQANYKQAVERGIEQFGQAFQRKATPLKREAGSDKGLLIDCDADDRYNTNKEYKGKYMMALKSTTAPDVLTKQTGLTKLTPEEIKENVYSGCYGKVTFNCYPYNKIATGVAAGLGNVFKTRDGDFMGGRVAGATDFSDEIDQAYDEASDDDLF